MKPDFFSSYNKWIIGVILLFSVTCKEREWEFYATVKTNEVTIFSNVAAVAGGTVIHDGHSVITETGICYSKLPNPDLNDNRINISGFISDFSGKIESLEPRTTYYVRAYAINNKGVSYGEEVSFTTNEPLTDVEGNIYETVIIGDQVWMAENMAQLPEVSPSSVESLTEPHYYVYGYTGTNISEAKATDNYKTFGVLYNWEAALQICPDGWHLPIDDEWEELAEYVSEQKGPYSKLNDNWRIVGKHLKSTGTINEGNGLWQNSGEGDVGTDDFSFTGLPGGCRDGDGTFKYKNQYGYWWSANESSATGDFYRSLSYYHTYFAKASPAKRLGFSVRCIKD